MQKSNRFSRQQLQTNYQRSQRADNPGLKGNGFRIDSRTFKLSFAKTATNKAVFICDAGERNGRLLADISETRSKYGLRVQDANQNQFEKFGNETISRRDDAGVSLRHVKED